MRPILCAAALAGLLLASCGPGAPEPQASAPNAAPALPAPALPAPAEPRWTLETSATAGTALVRADAAGGEVLRVACRANPPELYAAVPGVQRIGSEDRLTLGAGPELAVFVVSMDGPPEGLRATGQFQPAFIDALAAGRDVGVSYGARQMTLPPPPRETASAFAAKCAELAKIR